MRPRKTDRNLPPCVYHRHGAYWYVKAGKWTRLGTDLRRALERYAELSTATKGGMAELIQSALADMRPRLKQNTVAQYEIAARKLTKMLAEFAPQQVEPKDVARVKLKLKDTPNMANRCLSFLRLVFAYGVEQQIVASNPCIGIARFAEGKRDRYITDAELAAIHDKAGDRLRVIIDLCYYTGQRINDVLAIRRADLTDAGIRFKQGKTGVGLTVAWTPELRQTVAAAKGLNQSIVALTLLHNRRGKRPDYRTVREQWEKACAAAGVSNAHLHDLRAKSLTDAKRQGHDATALAGHASQAMTERYIRLRESPIVNGPSFGQSIDTATNS